MTVMHHRVHASAANRLGILAVLILLLAAGTLTIVTYGPLHVMQQDSERTRAQILAQAVSSRLVHALDIGIPLPELVGVDALLDQQVATHEEIQSIELQSPDGRILWSAARKADKPGEDGALAVAPVMNDERLIANVRLRLSANKASAFASSAAALLLPAALLLAVLAFWAAKFSEANGPRLRNYAVRLATASIAQQHYDRTFVLPYRRGFDLRVQQLSYAVRTVHETLVRVRRLISSLRQTEPERLRREQLDQLLTEAEGSDRFAPHELCRLHVIAPESQAFWASLLTSLTASALLSLILLQPSVQTSSSRWPSWLFMGIFLAAAAAGHLLTRGRHLRALNVQLTVCASLFFLVLVHIFSLLSFLSPPEYSALTALWCGGAMGAALSACSALERVPPGDNRFIHAYPLWPAATLGAWLYATVCLGPALGMLSFMALGLQGGLIALLLPAACAIAFLLSWNAPRSPWRTWLDQTERQKRVSSHQPDTAISIFAGGMLAAGALATSLSNPFTVSEAGQLCALGLGLMAGQGGALSLGQRTSRWLSLCAIVLYAMLLIPDPMWHIFISPEPSRTAIQWLAMAVTAYLLGHELHSGDSPRSTGYSSGLALSAVILLAIGAVPKMPLPALGLMSAIALAWQSFRKVKVPEQTPEPEGRNAA